MNVGNSCFHWGFSFVSDWILCWSKLENFLFYLICSHCCLATRRFNSFPSIIRSLLMSIALLNRESIRQFRWFLNFWRISSIFRLYLRIEIRLLIVRRVMRLMVRLLIWLLVRICFLAIWNIIISSLRILRVSSLFRYVCCRSNIFYQRSFPFHWLLFLWLWLKYLFGLIIWKLFCHRGWVEFITAETHCWFIY